jgi:hypothetical protein
MAQQIADQIDATVAQIHGCLARMDATLSRIGVKLTRIEWVTTEILAALEERRPVITGDRRS